MDSSGNRHLSYIHHLITWPVCGRSNNPNKIKVGWCGPLGVDLQHHQETVPIFGPWGGFDGFSGEMPMPLHIFRLERTKYTWLWCEWARCCWVRASTRIEQMHVRTVWWRQFHTFHFSFRVCWDNKVHETWCGMRSCAERLLAMCYQSGLAIYKAVRLGVYATNLQVADCVYQLDI